LSRHLLIALPAAALSSSVGIQLLTAADIIAGKSVEYPAELPEQAPVKTRKSASRPRSAARSPEERAATLSRPKAL
jgi:hypothetical protein